MTSDYLLVQVSYMFPVLLGTFKWRLAISELGKTLE